MEKVCEFCTGLRPLIYCKADAAYLCLSCDAKVHFANALSARHLRTLVCNSCRYHLAYVKCLDHKMLICRDCDQMLHDVSIPHRKRATRSFIGYPSATDFAKLWGLELNEMENSANQDQFASFSCDSEDSNVVQVNRQLGNHSGIPSMVSGAKLDGGSSSQQGQILCIDQERQTILQQIVDLNRHQLNVANNHSKKINELQETHLSSSALKKLDEKFNQQAQNSQGLATELLEKDNPVVELNRHTSSSTFSQLDNLSSSSIIGIPLHGESFWTCKSSLQSNQDSSAAAFITISQSAHENKHMNPLSQYCPRSMDPPPIIQPFESNMPFSLSRFGTEAESHYDDQNGSALSPIAHVEARGNVTVKFKDKKSQLMRSKLEFHPGNLKLMEERG